MTVRSLIARTGSAALICAATFLCGSALANDPGQPQQPMVTHPHGVPTTTTYSSGSGARLVVRGRPVNVQHGPTAVQLRQRTWDYFIGPPPPPPLPVERQGYYYWFSVTGAGAPFVMP